MAIIVKTRKCDGVKTYLIDFRDQKGMRVRETAGTSKKQAKNLLAKRLGEVRAGTYVNPRDLHDERLLGPTFSEFAERFLGDYGRLRRSDYYEQQVTVLVSYFGDKRLKSITRADIDLFGVGRSRQTVGKHAKRTVGASTVRKDLTILVTMFKLAVRWGLLDASPAVDVSKPSEPHHKVRYLSQEEWERLRATAAPWLLPILTMGVATGMRLKEILGLRWEDVDRKGGLLYLSEDNKTAEPRVIPIGKTVKAALDGQVRHIKTPWVFTDSAGQPYTGQRRRNYVGNATIAAMRRAGIGGASFHTLRHTVGSWLAQSGESEVIIAKLLGHASTKTTERYMHLQPKHLRAAVRTLDAALASRMDTQVDTRQNDAAVAPIPRLG